MGWPGELGLVFRRDWGWGRVGTGPLAWGRECKTLLCTERGAKRVPNHPPASAHPCVRVHPVACL